MLKSPFIKGFLYAANLSPLLRQKDYIAFSTSKYRPAFLFIRWIALSIDFWDILNNSEISIYE